VAQRVGATNESGFSTTSSMPRCRHQERRIAGAAAAVPVAAARVGGPDRMRRAPSHTSGGPGSRAPSLNSLLAGIAMVSWVSCGHDHTGGTRLACRYQRATQGLVHAV
jgi:hypothetical protein